MSAEQLSREEVVAFLDGQPGTPEGLEALTGGAWSSAWAYRAGSEELVVRFGPEVSWYEADRMAMTFGGPDLPVPSGVPLTALDGPAFTHGALSALGPLQGRT